MGLFPSKSVPDSEYLLIRSTLEANMAANAGSEQAAAAHHKIASCYLAKLFGGPSAETVDPGHSGRQMTGAHSGSIGPAELRFADLTAVPDDDELTRLLDKLS
jgi:hypothetical protein